MTQSKRLAKSAQRSSMRRRTLTGLVALTSPLGAERCGGAAVNAAKICPVVNSANTSTRKKKKKNAPRRNKKKF